MKTRHLNLRIVRRTVRMILPLIFVLGAAGPAVAVAGSGARLLAPAAEAKVVAVSKPRDQRGWKPRLQVKMKIVSQTERRLP